MSGFVANEARSPQGRRYGSPLTATILPQPMYRRRLSPAGARAGPGTIRHNPPAVKCSAAGLSPAGAGMGGPAQSTTTLIHPRTPGGQCTAVEDAARRGARPPPGTGWGMAPASRRSPYPPQASFVCIPPAVNVGRRACPPLGLGRVWQTWCGRRLREARGSSPAPPLHLSPAPLSSTFVRIPPAGWGRGPA